MLATIRSAAAAPQRAGVTRRDHDATPDTAASPIDAGELGLAPALHKGDTRMTGFTDTLGRTLAGTALAIATLAPAVAEAEEPTPWIRRHVPRRNTGELGIYGGITFPARSHELFAEDRAQPNDGFRRFRTAAPHFGLRAAYLPLRFFAVEAEAGVAPTRTTDDTRALLWTVRCHALAQLGLWRVTPFVLAGVGGLGVVSERGAVGRDVDLAFHFGAGVKLFATDRIVARLDVRDVVAARRGVSDGVAHTPEILLGLSVVLGRKPTPAPAPAREPAPELAPAPAAEPIGDRDRDTFLDPDDQCPDEPGVAPDGCPLRDTDGDGILDPDDACPKEPETRNGFEDTDGCPDELPEAVKRFSGVIEGIHFELNKDRIRPVSTPVLDRAVTVLRDYPSIRIEVSGHTDSTGKPAHNQDLSRRRAIAVRQYLVDHGIAADRVTTRGAGPDEPLADNATDSGRQKNRRIEFRVIEAKE